MRRRLQQIGNIALTAMAAIGALCVLLTLAGLLFGVRPLVFTSGSMSPSIEAGDLAFARAVDAADLEVGDVVSISVEGSRVTHRIADLERDGDRAVLTLRGDANAVDDADTRSMTSADRVFLRVPGLGHAVS